jgi:predicted ArsR family transcriptional regulator
VESRDFEASTLAIQQAANAAGWEALGDGIELTKIRAGRRAAQAMAEHGEPLTAEKLGELLNVSRTSALRQLQKLEHAGLVTRSAEVRDGSKKPVDVWRLIKPKKVLSTLTT